MKSNLKWLIAFFIIFGTTYIICRSFIEDETIRLWLMGTIPYWFGTIEGRYRE